MHDLKTIVRLNRERAIAAQFLKTTGTPIDTSPHGRLHPDVARAIAIHEGGGAIPPLLRPSYLQAYNRMAVDVFRRERGGV